MARGDYAGAALSLLSAIPFAGWLGTAGKVGRHGAKAVAEASEKAAKVAAERAAKEAADKAAKEAAEKKARDEAARKARKEESGGKVKQPRVVKKNGYTYHLDENGRVTKVEGDLKLNKGQGRNPATQKQAGGPDRLPDDQGGHYIGRRFDGPKDDFNHFAQNGNFNNSAYKKLENSWERALKDGKSVRVEISPSFKGGSLRPDTLKVRQWIDRKPQPLRVFRNAPGG
ncbi:DNA/RNA non-specific endonuclease [compost metagenome]